MRQSDFRNITIFTNKHRIKTLEDFRDLLVRYFAAVTHSWMADATIESPEAKALRPQINMEMRRAREYVQGANVGTAATAMPAPAVGGYPTPFCFIEDVFRMRDFSLTEQGALDRIDRAIGIYKHDQQKATVRTYNPFWWIGRGVVWIARLPFMALGAAGFNAVKIEESLAGKVVKAVVYAATAALTFLQLWNLANGGGG